MAKKDDFNRAADKHHSNWRKDSTELAPTLERKLAVLERQRDKPIPSLELTPNSDLQKIVKSALETKNENEIRDIQNQLRRIKEARSSYGKRQQSKDLELDK